MRQDPLREQARLNRKNLNHAETRLWWDLKGEGYEFHFRRQHVVLGYIVDFACVSLKLIIEVDGWQHIDSEEDRVRDGNLRDAGWTVLRFSSSDVFKYNEMVLRTIGATIDKLLKSNE